MSFIPSSPAEVKSIIEAVNLRTFTRFTFLKGAHQVCKFPLAEIKDGFKDLVFTPDGLLFDGADPDANIILSNTPDVPPGHPHYAGDPTLYFERQPRPGEVKEGHLIALRAWAVAQENPREILPAEAPRQAPRRDNVVKLPDVEKRPVRHDRPPRDVLKYSRSIPIGEEWKRFYAVMYDRSWYGPINQAGGYAGKSKKKMRLYTQGNKELVRSTGLSKYTVSRYLTKLKKYKLILQHKRGWPGEKCSIWELPFSLEHVFAWRRDPAGSRHRST